MKSSSKEHIQALTVDTLRSLVKSFFEKITEEQWNLIISGCTNEKTRILLAEFLLDIIISTTTTLLAAVKCEASVSSLDEAFPRSFSEALSIPDQAEDDTFKCLTGMIQTEVKKNLEAILSENKKHVTPFSGLDSMINHASGLLKRFGKKMNKSFALKKQKEVKTEEYMHVLNGDDGELKSKIQEKLEEELNEIVSPMMDHVPVTEYEKVCSDTAFEVRVLSRHLLRSSDKIQDQKILRKTRCKVRNFLTKCFLTIWIRRLLDQLKRKHCPSKKADSAEAVEELIENIQSWLHSKNETSIVLALDNVSSGNDLVFTENLCNFLHKYWQENIYRPDDVSRCSPESHYELQADIWRKSWTCQVIMNWFLKTMLTQLVEKVKLPTKNTPTEPEVVGLASDTNDASDTEKQVYIRFLIEKVVHHLYQDAKMVPNYHNDLVNHMFQKVYNELQVVEWHITEDSFKELDKKIHKHFCKPLGTTDEIMQLWTDCYDPTVPRCIISIAKNPLKEPTNNRNWVVKCFSLLKQLFSKSQKSTTRL